MATVTALRAIAVARNIGLAASLQPTSSLGTLVFDSDHLTFCGTPENEPLGAHAALGYPDPSMEGQKESEGPIQRHYNLLLQWGISV